MPNQKEKDMHNSSVILINYNTSELTLQAVHSVLNHHSGDFEILIVDNASKSDDYNNLKKGVATLKDPRVEIIRSRINTGFGMGNMIGVQKASGKYYVFLNSDAYLTEDSISIMTNFLENNSRASIVGAKLKDEHGRSVESFDFRLSLRRELLGVNILHLLNSKKYPSRKKEFTEPTRVGAVPGSFFVCRASDFDKVGGFDSNLFLYYEEKDLSFRIEKQLGKEIYTLPQTSFVHLKGKSTGSSYEIKKELRISQFYSIRKNLGPLKYWIFFVITFLKVLVKAPFSRKNQKHLFLLLNGASLSLSLKHKQEIMPYAD